MSQDAKGFTLITGASSGIDAFGNAHEIGDGSVPPDLEVKVRLAASYCPELAANDCIHRVIDTYHIRTRPLEGDDKCHCGKFITR